MGPTPIEKTLLPEEHFFPLRVEPIAKRSRYKKARVAPILTLSICTIAIVCPSSHLHMTSS